MRIITLKRKSALIQIESKRYTNYNTNQNRWTTIFPQLNHIFFNQKVIQSKFFINTPLPRKYMNV